MTTAVVTTTSSASPLAALPAAAQALPPSDASAQPAPVRVPQRFDLHRLTPVAIAATLMAFAVFVAWRRYQQLAESPFPLGIDGYFYPIQLRGILETGIIDSPAPPLAFYLMAPFALVTDPIVGAKLGAAWWCAAAVFPAYGIARRLSGFRTTGLVAAALVGLCHGGFYLTLEFVKNGIGITVALTLVWLLLRALDNPSRTRIAWCAVGLVAAWITHKIAAPLALIVTLPAIVITVRSRRHVTRNVLIVGALGSVAVMLLALRAGWSELQILFTSQTRWELPALALPRHPLMMGHEPWAAAVVALLFVACAVALWRSPMLRARLHYSATVEQRVRVATTLAFAGLALCIALPWLEVGNPQGLAFRLRIIAFVPLAMVSSVVLSMAVQAIDIRAVAGAAGVAIALVLTWSPTRINDGVVYAHPAMVAAVQGLTDEVPRNAFVIVPERHIAFMTAWYVRARVRLRPESAPANNRYRLITLSFISAGSALEHTIDQARAEPGLTPPLGVHPMHPNGLVLIEEATWQWILAELPPNLRARPAAWPTI